MLIRKPPQGGPQYYNYNHSHSIILIAISGLTYECLYEDVGTNGRVNDGGVWDKCGCSKATKN